MKASLRLFGRLLAPEDRGMCTVTVVDGRITEIAPRSTPPGGALGGESALIIPGLVDLQLNGCFGQDFSDPATDLAAAAVRLPATGVTAFLPTVVSSAPDLYGPVLRNLSGAVPVGAAKPLGVHVEGPFLNPERAGTHDPATLRPPDTAEALRWLEMADVRIVTLAPELEGALNMIRTLTERGVLVSLGHSEATWQETGAALDAGAHMGTHLFNAMRPIHHRDPGICARLLASGAAVSVIADGVHVAPETVQMVAGVKQPDELVLITDGLAALGEPAGDYSLAGRTVISDGTAARLADGTLSGSVVPFASALGRLARAGLDPSMLVRAASTAPARLIGREAELGRIAEGRAADLVCLDSDWQPLATLVAGELAYSAPQECAEVVTRRALAKATLTR